MLQNVNINSSDLSKYTGDNPFCTSEESISSFWACNKALASVLGVKCKPKFQSSVHELLCNCKEDEKNLLADSLGKSKAEDPGDLSHAITQNLVAPAIFEITNESSIKALESACRSMDLPSDLADKLKQACGNDVQRTRGMRKEKQNIDNFSKSSGQIVQSPRIMLSMVILKHNGCNVVLRGIVDGILKTTGYVIEVKERRNRLFNKVVPYERVQLHCYMKLAKSKRALLREQYDGQANEHWVEFDEIFWSKCIKNLKAFLGNVAPALCERHVATSSV